MEYITVFYSSDKIVILYPPVSLCHVHCMKYNHRNHCDSKYDMLFRHKDTIRFSIVELGLGYY